MIDFYHFESPLPHSPHSVTDCSLLLSIKTIAALLFGVLAVATGCGGSSAEVQRADANRLAVEGQTKLSEGDPTGAEAAFAAALEAGGLNIDTYEQVILLRAVALAQLGQADQALESLEPIIAQGSSDLGLAAKSYVLEKKGDSTGAKQAFAAARRLNSTVQAYTDRPSL